jgi:glucose dehydrogenase
VRSRLLVSHDSLEKPKRFGRRLLNARLPGTTIVTSVSLDYRTPLAFIGSSMDDAFRAFDVDTGRILWTTQLPAGGKIDTDDVPRAPKAVLVIAAGGHGKLGTTLGD